MRDPLATSFWRLAMLAFLGSVLLGVGVGVKFGFVSGVIAYFVTFFLTTMLITGYFIRKESL